MDPLTIVSQSIAAGGLTGARPALTLFLLQAYGLFLARPNLPDNLSWLLNEYLVGVCGALAIAEHFVRTEPDFEEIMRYPNAVIGVGVAVMGALLITTMGYTPEQWQDVSKAASLGWGAYHTAGASDAGGTMTLSMVAASFASLGLGWARHRILDALGALAVPGRWWRWIETGGVTGLTAMVVLLPFLALGLVILIGVIAGLAAGGIWGVQTANDRRKRVACTNPACDYKPRQEATVCPKCKTPQAAHADADATAARA
jgi:hypothetical protein